MTDLRKYFLLGVFYFPHICFAAAESKLSGEDFIQLCKKNRTEKIKANFKNVQHTLSDKSNGYTPLHYAVIHKNESLTLFFLEHGEDPNTSDKTLETALHFAAKNGYYNITKILLENHANRFLKDKKGETPLTLAMKHNQWSIARLLSTCFPPGEKTKDPLYEIIFPS